MRHAALMIALLLPIGLLAGESQAADRWVSRRGVDSPNDCLAAGTPCKTIEYALTVATSGDTVNVAGGKYKVRLEIRNSTTLTLLGGWDTTFTTRNPQLTPTTLKARKVLVVSPFGAVKDKRVLLVIAQAAETITLTIDGLVLTGGNAVAASAVLLGNAHPPLPFPLLQDGGGGLYALAVGGTITMTVRQSAITRNRSRVVAGGGAFVGASRGGTADVTFDRTTITENKVDYGGGLEAVSAQLGTEPPSSVHVRMVNSVVAGNQT